MIDQKLINTVVDATLTGTMTCKIEETYIESSSIYNDNYNTMAAPMYSWIQDGDTFERAELCYWDSYLDEEVGSLKTFMRACSKLQKMRFYTLNNAE
ncbi:MAG TPA: hypothetical protein DCY55_09525 [Gammaproteobacteria bacterium]|mgnify:CR=1 FL=1|jgi:hypothetical protein|nr:hypothetical protein [Gammaproteobacteria bacterium]